MDQTTQGMTPIERRELFYFMVVTTILNILIIFAIIYFGFTVKETFDSRLKKTEADIEGINVSVKGIYGKLEEWDTVTEIK